MKSSPTAKASDATEPPRLPARPASQTSIALTSLEPSFKSSSLATSNVGTALMLPEAASAPLDLVLRSPQSASAERLRIDESTILIGRGSQCDLRLTHRDVSRRHALLQRVAGGLLVVDLCSRTGISRNGERVALSWL
ncbi:MAG: FHA domain-containing protein, partial [Planctomycetota bacterium]|nr:FHA domain-containing protein [Planctomycetota bacterium]